MLYLAVLLLIPIAIIAGLIYASRKLSTLKFFFLIFSIVAVSYTAFHVYETKFRLSVVPDALGVTTISYQKEESWGFGPGGNEAGIRVCPLPDEISKLIEANGISFFNNMPPNDDQNSKGRRGVYENWAETPIKIDSHWKPSKDNSALDIYDYICAYGFCIDIDPAVVAEANAIVNAKGSYYAFGRLGLIIVNPSRSKIFYIYNG